MLACGIERSFGEGTKPCRVWGRDAVEFSRLQLSYSRCKARKIAPKLLQAKSDAHHQTVRNTTTGATGPPYNTGPPRETAHQNSEDGNAPIAPQSDYTNDQYFLVTLIHHDQ